MEARTFTQWLQFLKRRREHNMPMNHINDAYGYTFMKGCTQPSGFFRELFEGYEWRPINVKSIRHRFNLLHEMEKQIKPTIHRNDPCDDIRN